LSLPWQEKNFEMGLDFQKRSHQKLWVFLSCRYHACRKKGFFGSQENWFSRNGSTFENQDPFQNFSLANTNSKKWSKCLIEARIDL